MRQLCWNYRTHASSRIPQLSKLIKNKTKKKAKQKAPKNPWLVRNSPRIYKWMRLSYVMATLGLSPSLARYESRAKSFIWVITLKSAQWEGKNQSSAGNKFLIYPPQRKPVWIVSSLSFYAHTQGIIYEIRSSCIYCFAPCLFHFNMQEHLSSSQRETTFNVYVRSHHLDVV